LLLAVIDVSHESVRHWAEKFGREYSNRIRRRAPARGGKWHMDEVVITIRGKKHWLWRAVDQQGFVLDVLVQNRRDRTAAQRLMRKLLKKVGQSAQRHDYDKLKSYGAARKDMGLGIEHRQHKGLNNRAENAHLPTRRRERIVKRFKSPRQVQKFLSIHDQVANLFHFPATNSQPSIIAPLALRPSRPGQRSSPHGLRHDAALIPKSTSPRRRAR